VLVSGRVQGVWFRERCRQQASSLGVHGWVRNLDDGRVEVLIEGETASVAALEAWCRVGPPSALVTGVEVEPCPPQNLTGFAVVG
jgi:acylphosphatase